MVENRTKTCKGKGSVFCRCIDMRENTSVEKIVVCHACAHSKLVFVLFKNKKCFVIRVY